jgi:uncharacterized membrane protein
MYSSKIPVSLALKNTFKNIKKQKTESLVYLIAQFLIKITLSILSTLVIIIPFLILLLIGIGLFLLTLIISPVLTAILLIPYIILSLFSLAVLILPLNVFFRYYTILCYEKLFNKRLLKKLPYLSPKK